MACNCRSGRASSTSASTSDSNERRELQVATRDPEVKQALRGATDAAHARGVIGVPTIAIDERLFWGDDRVQDAAAHLRERLDAPGRGLPAG